MSPDPTDKPAIQEPEVEVIDLEVMEENTGGMPGMSPGDFLKMAPDMVVKVFRGMILERLKKWLLRNLVVCTVLLIFAQEHSWARVLLWIWGVIQALYLAFLLYGWYASGKQAAKLAQVFGGMTGGQSRGDE